MHLLMNGGQLDAVEVEPQRACVDFSCHRFASATVAGKEQVDAEAPHFGLLHAVAARSRCVALRTVLHTQPDNAVEYATFFSRSHHAVICVYDEAANVIRTHEHTGDFKE